MFLATLVMVAGVTLTTLSRSLGSGSVPSFYISCFSIRTQHSWHFMKGTEAEVFSSSSSSSPRGWGSRENDRGIQIVTIKGPNCLKPLSFKAGSSCVAEVLLHAPLRWKGWLHQWHLRVERVWGLHFVWSVDAFLPRFFPVLPLLCVSKTCRLTACQNPPF